MLKLEQRMFPEKHEDTQQFQQFERAENYGFLRSSAAEKQIYDSTRDFHLTPAKKPQSKRNTFHSERRVDIGLKMVP